MEDDKIIEAFIQVVEKPDNVFSAEAIADIPTLQQNLSAIQTLTSDAIAEVLCQWYINHENVRDAILMQGREITKVQKTKPQSQEKTLENRYRLLQEELKKLQARKS
ncbi:MAG TPA: hypothetical protein DCL61_08730 [Cyanobacteria bacterium UBA12227]|nr:hypothetical protein [Cyanobacteria bacterium UBA12227]HAX85258.1 hypothetical protein [Cyanobacteria bacterium UBA11370]HBY77579.1 hypothetical protein [Cyanobacteria bacterium UBA11148]